jgi:hypothetical protein
MALAPVQNTTLKADILADPALADERAAGDTQAIADAYNAPAVPDFWVWRTSVAEAEYTGQPGVDAANGGAATVFSWTAFIARSVQEQNGWNAMFRGGSVNPSLPAVRQGVADIFSGSTNSAPAQRNHLLVLSKRRATRFERLFATGTGSFAAPGTMAAEGPITHADVSTALAS